MGRGLLLTGDILDALTSMLCVLHFDAGVQLPQDVSREEVPEDVSRHVLVNACDKMLLGADLPSSLFRIGTSSWSEQLAGQGDARAAEPATCTIHCLRPVSVRLDEPLGGTFEKTHSHHHQLQCAHRAAQQ